MIADDAAVPSGWSQSRVVGSPIGELHFDRLPAAEMVDHRLEGDGERARRGQIRLPSRRRRTPRPAARRRAAPAAATDDGRRCRSAAAAPPAARPSCTAWAAGCRGRTAPGFRSAAPSDASARPAASRHRRTARPPARRTRCARPRARRNRCGTRRSPLSSIVSPAAAAWPPWPNQVLAAGRERRVQIEAGHAAARADARLAAQLVERNQHHRPMILLGQPAGHDADHARVPAAPGEHERRHVARVAQLLGLLVGRPVDAPLQRLPLLVEAVDELGQLARPARANRSSTARWPAAPGPTGRPR